MKDDVNKSQQDLTVPYTTQEANLPSVATQSFDCNLLIDVIQKLSMAKDINTIMYLVRTTARKLMGADGATFVLMDGNQCYYADEDAVAPLWKGKRFPLDECISGWVMKHRFPAIIEDIYQDERIPIEAYRPTFIKSLTMVPIRTAAPFGAIGVYWAQKHLPSNEQIILLQSLADSTSVAMENVQLQAALLQEQQESSMQLEITRKLMETNQHLELALTQLHRRNEEILLLKELSATLQTCIYLEEAFQLVTQYIPIILPETSGSLYIMHPSHNYLEAMSFWGDPLQQEKVLKPEECLALRRGSVFKSINPQKEFICSHCRSNPKPYTCIPLFAQSTIIGLIYVEWNFDILSNVLAKDNYQNLNILVCTCAEQIALAIPNINLRENLRNQSFRDTLSGLYNRRYLDETVDREISRCQRKSASLAVLLLDIDHFKQFNDKFGHDAGDMVIKAAAQVLINVVRKADIVCRYGGEEFMVILPEISRDVVLQRAQEIHEAISKIHLQYGGTPLSPITVSIGLALYPEDGHSIRDLTSAADLALYEAKNTGRNKTILFKTT